MSVTITAGELLDRELDAFCLSCGRELPQPGLPCTECGTIPPVTRAEASARLELPGTIAMIEASRLRGEARVEQDATSAKLAEADRIEHIDSLEQARDQAAAKLPGARAEVARLGKELKRAQAREGEAAGREADARRNFTEAYNGEEAARRCAADAATRTAALVRMNAAASVLQGDQGALQGAAAVRRQAADALEATRQHLARLDADRAAAQRALDHPGRTPKSAFTLTMDAVRQLLGSDLDEGERAYLRDLGEIIATHTGAGEDIAKRAEQAAGKAAADAHRREARFLRPLGNGGAMVQRIPAGNGTRQ